MPRQLTTSWNIQRAALAALLACQSGPAIAADLPAVVKFIPRDAEAALVIPNLAIFSDELLTCLEGMDRAHLLLGARPIDQIKSASGFTIAVDDAGSAALIMRVTDADEPVVAIVIPVTDAAAFLKGNFVEHDGSAYRRSDGRMLHATALGSHVVMATHPQALTGFDAVQEPAPFLAAGEAVDEFLARGDAFVYLRPAGFERLNALVVTQARNHGLEIAGIERLIRRLSQQLSAVAMGFDFDPLGLVIRSRATYAAESQIAQRVRPSLSADAFNRLPLRPFFLAIRADVAAIRDLAQLEDLFGDDVPCLAQWLGEASAIQCAAYVSTPESTGGWIADAIAVVEHREPAQAKAALRQCLTEIEQLGDGIERQVMWEEAKPLNESLIADAYAVKVTGGPRVKRFVDWIWTAALAGPQGWHGFVSEIPRGLLITFNQRIDALQAALQTADGQVEKGADRRNLASHAAIKSMRAWLPAEPHLELYIGAGQVLDRLRRAADQGGGGISIPSISPTAPPIAFGASVSEGVDSAAIIPAPVLAVIFDEVSKRLMPQPAAP